MGDLNVFVSFSLGNKDMLDNSQLYAFKSLQMHDFFYTEKIVSLNQRNISLIYGQGKNFFESKKVLLIQKKILGS